MRRFCGLLRRAAFGLALAAAWALSAAADPFMVVDWGGDYVTANATLQGTIVTVSTDDYGGTSSLDRRRYIAFSDVFLMSPASGYSGSSADFHGGWNSIRYDTSTNPNNAVQVLNSGTNDLIQFPFGLSASGSGEGACLAVWMKGDFLSGSGQTLALTPSCALQINIALANVGTHRLVVKNGSQYYVSNTAKSGTGLLTIADPTAETWATFNPENGNHRLNDVGGSFTTRTFDNVQALGYYWSCPSGTVLSTVQNIRVQDVDFMADIAVDIYPPDAPTLTSPHNGTSTTNTMPEFTWQAITNDASGIKQYDIWIDDTTNSVLSPAASFTPGAALGLGPHSWQVRAVDNASPANTGAWSAAWTFTIVSSSDTTPPDAPALVSPTNTAITMDVTPEFVWNAVTDSSGIARYDIQIDAAVHDVGTATNYTSGTLTVGAHTWQVRAVDDIGNTGAWSTAWTFTIVDNTPPPPPTLQGPANGAHSPTPRPTFAWSTVSDDSGISRYDIQIDATVYDAALNTIYTPAAFLSVASHAWQVRAVDGAGNTGAWSSAWTVTIDPFALYWDGNGATAPDPAGDGTWDASVTTNWNTQVDYGGVYCTWQQGGGSEARFPSIGGTISIEGTVSVSQITIEPNAIVILTNGVVDLTGIARIGVNGDVGADNGVALNVYSGITGTNGLSVSHRMIVDLYGANTYTGPTVLGNNGENFTIHNADAIPASSVITSFPGRVNNRLVIASNIVVTSAGIEGDVVLSGDGGGLPLMILDRSAGTSVWANGSAGQEIGIAKRGAYTQVFTADSTRTETLIVEGGVLALDCVNTNAAVANTRVSAFHSKIALAGGTLRLDLGEQIQDAAELTMTGGVFNLNGFSETLSNLTVAADSTLDFGSGAAIETCLGSATWTAGLLTIANWSGTPNTGGGADQLRVVAGPAAGFLNHIQFNGYPTGAVALNMGAFYEILPPADTIPPAAPVLSAPPDGSRTSDDTPEFAWNAVMDVSGIARYDVQIDAAVHDAGAATSYTSGTLSPGAHTWQVRAVDGSANTGAWSAAWTVTIDTAPPAPPALVSPTNTALTVYVMPTFTWSATTDPSGIARYDIQIDSTVYNAGTATNYTPSGPLSAGDRAWQVRAVDGVGNTGAWSVAWTVTVAYDGTPPPAPELLSPTNDAHSVDATPTFLWSAVSDLNGIRRYDLQIGAAVRDVGVNTNYTPEAPLPAGAYTWQVRAVDGAQNTGDWSSAWTVTIDPFPLYWDGNGAAAPNPAGEGVWDASSTSNWNARSDYGGAYYAWTDGGGEAWFPALTNAVNTVTIEGTVTVSEIVLDTNNGTPATILTNGTLNLASAARIRPVGNPGANFAPTLRIYSDITGSAGLTVSNRVNVLLFGTNTYAGPTTLGNAVAKLTIADSSALPVTTILSGGFKNDGDVVILGTVTAMVAGVELNVGIEGDTLGRARLIMDRVSGTSVWTAGTLSREIELVKRGGYTQVFAGDSGRTDLLGVEGGLLALNNTNANNKAVASTRDAAHWSKIKLAGGTLRLDGSEQIQDTAALTMTGGVFNLNGFSETLSNLTVAANSTLDFGDGAATNTYLGSVAWTNGTLTIANWSGDVTRGGGVDQLRVAARPAAAFLDHVHFAGSRMGATVASFGTYYEILPMPQGALLMIR